MCTRGVEYQTPALEVPRWLHGYALSVQSAANLGLGNREHELISQSAA